MLRHGLAPEIGALSVQRSRSEDTVAYGPPTKPNNKAKTRAKNDSTHKKAGRRADKIFGATKTTQKASRKKDSGKSAATGTTSMKWITTGTNNAAIPEAVVTYLTTLASHQAAHNSEFLLGTVEALLRQGGRDLAFTDDSLISIVERCHRATFASSATDFLCMVQYLQLVFKVSRCVLYTAFEMPHTLITKVIRKAFSSRTIST